jgi:signal transduction histidine kinase
LLALGVGVMALAAGIAMVMAVRPLARRIELLRRAAQRVGAAEGYVSGATGTGDELDELSQMLDGAHDRIRKDAARLEERQRGLERYLADVAHDLRTPITSLQLALEQSLDARAEGERAELLQSALKDVIYLSGLTNNLRLACQLREGWDPLSGNHHCDLADTVERVAVRARIFARRRGIELDLARPDGPVVVRCHPTAAEQAVRNVVENAITYGDPGGHVAIVLEPVSNGSRFALAIVDDGPGVLPTELPRLGERTFRSDEARQRDPQGSGLGLAITSEISARCGFTLSFHSESPRGLRVTIEGPTMGASA